jgi:SNF2 family DNA or RNA helicase
MLVKPKHRKLVINLRDPTKVLNIIPTARTLEYKGHTLTVVPHRIPETRILRNLGFDPPHPVDHYYRWPIKRGWAPMEHQKETVRLLTLHPRAYCLDDMGTGKTLSALWAFDFLRQEGLVKTVLVISPLSTIERTWADEVFWHFPHLKTAVLHGTREQRRAALSSHADVYVINHDGVKTILDDLIAKSCDVVLIDELAQAARNAGTDRWKAYKKLTEKTPILWGMTGTPIPNAPTDAWAQCRLITPSTVPAYYSHFRDRTMRQVTEFKWAARPDALETVHQAMQPAIRHKRDEVIDLPPVMYETRHAALTKEQTRMYQEMWNTLYTQARGHGITAVNEAVKAMKAIQICTGSAYGDDDGNTIVCPPKHRLVALRDIIEEASSKVIVFVPFRGALNLVAEVLGKGYSVESIHGGVSKGERDRIFSAFQKGSDPRVLVAQPGAMSHGLTLTAASVVVWFAPITSAETYEQANARITRPGQKHSQLIVHLQGTDLEARMYERLKSKTTMQGVLLDMFRKVS